MKITVMAALAVATFALAPLAYAAEGEGDPFSFSAGPIGAVQVAADGTAVTLPDKPDLAYAAHVQAPVLLTDRAAEPQANDASTESELGR